ncbi:MAG TPA: TerB family tellurite resistance protein [Aquabacterium sp.]|uniref:tellurite resistance TerB family protein n=1 Tax=Aquabacterium sp. TaxID=1872578 RepID=UPI002D927A2D|nr:TerB family tellurite resistance protein [Aquabacterium sp.]HET6788090.1 TerB family tellurite resistance protein [Aquabacterium sp.]HEX5374189.1 TerB family tellurite resistance protein [Aquabacterium sp.]
MRSYPQNSPQAAARIVALVLISDGHVCKSEIDALNHLQIESELGLPPGGFAPVVQTLCEDLLLSTGSLGGVDESTLASLLAEVDAPALRLTVLRLADAAIVADRHLSEGEAQVMTALHHHWVLNDPAPALQAA